MTITNSTRALAATAFIALLAGCSGGSALAPSGTTAQGPTQSAAHVAMIKNGARPFASTKANAMWQTRGPIVNMQSRGFVPVQDDGKSPEGKSLIFASDNFTGNVDAYNESTGALAYQCAGCGGWGVAVSKGHGNHLAVGTFGGEVTIWKVGSHSISLISTLTESLAASGYNADGVTWDDKGGVYASDWPSNTVDYWNASAVAAGGAPTSSFQVSALDAVYYLSWVKKPAQLEASGYDSSLNVDLVNATTDTIQNVDGNLSQGTGFPGGVDTDKSTNVYMNDQYGTITEYPNAGNQSASASCNWGFDPNDYTGIALGTAETSVWGADINFGSGLESYGQEDTLPLSGSCSATLNTSPAQVSEEYLGIASYKRGNN